MKTYLWLLAALIPLSFPALAEEAPVACPMLAKICPDGSFVAPEGPKCKMAACPDGGDAKIPAAPVEEDCTGDECEDDKKTDEQND